MNRRLEDKIRHLSDLLVATDEDAEEFPSLAAELRAALRQHIERFRSQGLVYPPGRVRQRPAFKLAVRRVKKKLTGGARHLIVSHNRNAPQQVRLGGHMLHRI